MSSAAFDDHSAWLQAQQTEYNERLSRASYASEGRHSEVSFSEGAVDAGDLDSAWVDERIGFAGGMELPAMLNESLCFDDFDEGPVYRSLGTSHLQQPSGGDSPPAPVSPAPLVFRSTFAHEAAPPMDSIDASWLAGSNPPLIRRQNAFGRA